MLEMPFFLARPYAAPPGVPKERTAILMKAFMETHKDKDYLADAKKQKMDVSPIDGNDIRDMLTTHDRYLAGRHRALQANRRPRPNRPKAAAVPTKRRHSLS